MRGEGAGCGSAGDLLHHRGFDFEVAASVEEGADGAEDGGTLDEDLADVAGASSSVGSVVSEWGVELTAASAASVAAGACGWGRRARA